MTCREAERLVMPYINGSITDEELKEFLKHIETCEDCREELEIYYTLIVGMHQVDNNQELSQNFAKDLENELNRLEHRVKQAKRFKFSTFGLVFGVAVVFLFFVYNQCLDKVYNIEQRMKLEAQGDTYFYDTFGSEMSVCLNDIVQEVQIAQKPKGSTFYEKLREYQLTHPESEETESDE